MGGRGTYAIGNNVSYAYQTVGKIGDVKILKPIDNTKSLKLPEEAHSSSKYVLLDRNGVFHQYREYNTKHEVIMEIGYHHEKALGKGDVLHIHIHSKPGIEHHGDSDTIKRKLTRKEFEYYKKLLRGVKINEREYFS